MGGVKIIRRKRMIFLFSVLAGLVNDGWRTFFFNISNTPIVVQVY